MALATGDCRPKRLFNTFHRSCVDHVSRNAKLPDSYRNGNLRSGRRLNSIFGVGWAFLPVVVLSDKNVQPTFHGSAQRLLATPQQPAMCGCTNRVVPFCDDRWKLSAHLDRKAQHQVHSR